MTGNRLRSSLLLRTQIIGFSFPAATLSVYGKSAIYVKSCIATLGASMIHCRRAKSSHCSALKTKQFLGQIRPALPFSWSFSSSCVSAGLHFDAIDVNSPEDRGRCLLAPASLSISRLGDDAVNVHAKTLRVACGPACRRPGRCC